MPGLLWTGGMLGAVFVATSNFAIPIVGVGVYVTAALLGQFIVSMTIDHNCNIGGLTGPVK